jgi:hypothetical protein
MFRYKNQIFFITVGAIGVLGVYVAYMTVDRYETIVNAALGIAVLYLLHLRFLLLTRSGKEPNSIRLEFPKDLRYLVYGFVLAVIMFWAGVRVLEVVWHFIRVLTDT